MIYSQKTPLIVKLEHSAANFVFTTDWHLSDIPPGRRRDNYRASLLEKLAFVRDLTIKVKGIALCGGDVFHVKNPRSRANSHSLVEEVTRILGTFPYGYVPGTIGNHDIEFDRIETLPDQPLGVLIAAQVYHNLAAQPIIFENQDNSVRVLVETIPYCGEKDTLEWLLTSGSRPADVNYRVGIVHAYGRPGSDSEHLFDAPVIGYSQVKDIDFDIMLWGHDHSRKETATVGNVTHVNLGSLARAAFAYDEVERPVCATILSFTKENIKLKEKHIPVKPLEVAFQEANKAVERVTKVDVVTAFFTNMDEAVDGIESNDPREVLITLGKDDKLVTDLAIELCEL